MTVSFNVCDILSYQNLGSEEEGKFKVNVTFLLTLLESRG